MTSKVGKLLVWFGVLTLALYVMWPKPQYGAVFSSPAEKAEFYSGLGVPPSSIYPLVLSADWCPICKNLEGELDQGKIAYVRADIEKNPLAARLFEKAASVAKSRGIPKVIVEGELIPPNILSIKAKLAELTAARFSAGNKE